MVVITVPQMQDRSDVRSISAHVADIAGVVALRVDLPTKTVQVAGDVAADAVRAAIVAAGYPLPE